MKKIIIAGFLTLLLLLVPISTQVNANNLKACDGELGEQRALLLISKEDISELESYVNSIEDNKMKINAEKVLNYVISKDGEVNLEALGEVIDTYDYDGVSGLPGFSPVQQLIDNIIGIIQGHLGWVYECFIYARTIVQNGIRLLNDAKIPAQIIDDIKLIIEDLSFIVDLTKMLISTEWWDFLSKWELRIGIIQNIIKVVEQIQSVVADVGIIIQDLISFVNSVTNFVNWVGSEPWTGAIHVYGQVLEGVTGCSNAKVTCRGTTFETDDEGNFDFYVNPSNTDDDSIPPNSWYGMHNCIIVAEKDNETKQSPDFASYVFSGGEMYWLFSFKKNGDSKEAKEDFSKLNFIRKYFSKLFLNIEKIFDFYNIKWLNKLAS
jgi:hypothetical protein